MPRSRADSSTPAVWRAHTRQLRDVQVLAGCQRTWALRKHVFSETFQAFYEDNIRQGTPKNLYSLPAGDASSGTGQ